MVGNSPEPAASGQRCLPAVELHARRKIAVAWLEHWCGWPPGEEIPKTDPRYIDCTEGRDRTPAQQRRYSSCADLAHGMLFRAGVRALWINRAEHHGWRPGVNVSRLVSHAVRWDGHKLEGGDVLVIANQWPSGQDAHVVCVVDEGVAGWLSTAQYGASGMRVGGIGGRLRTYDAWDRKRIGRRLVRVVLPFEAVLREAAARELLVDPVYPSETHVVTT